MFELVESVTQSALIKVIGVGGGGGNAVQYMVDREVEGVEFICANTDAQALSRNAARTALHIGGDLTKGLGAGANPEIGRQAALEDRERIAETLSGADMVFITAGMGGGTGTGAAPIVAEVARELGILTVAVVTRPFPFEGRKRMKIAEAGITELRDAVDSLIIIPNEKLMQVLGKNCSLVNAFSAANDVLKGAVQGIADLITRPGMINVDFADVRTVMSAMGMAMMGTAIAHGDSRAEEAAEAAIRSPLLEDIDLRGASGILVNIAAGEDLSLGEFTEVGNIVEQYADEDATIVVGTVIDPSLGDDLKVTVVATGLDRVREPEMEVVQGAGNNSRKPDGSLNLDEIELPTILRRQREEALVEKPKQDMSGEAPSSKDDYGTLDIPTFLRRQAD
ncbi:cell division protein FtsZ [Marinobacterium weihaiense]|uniref:Cell division protein FtsZ n=1 Tax=Marinobacterium weihaiense TaxID=2851016 RepID=A0ABS6M8U0_9GAMM|nr:cell division protein FtsZ [Marinobacterium weihaiense]MBV0932701.1 cell division protein FtsZ [Marinobacterium weihaiense]